MEFFLFGIILGFLGLIGFAALYFAAFVIRKLADKNILFTYAKETAAKAIMWNGRFFSFIMAFKGHCFAGDLNTDLPELQRWNVVAGELPPETSLPFLKGVKWIGLPPFREVYKYRFSWSSLEEGSASQDLEKKSVWSEKTLDYIYLREDVYVTKLETAECNDKIPLDAILLVSGRVVNPYKALFAIERWLEASLNVVDARMRSFFGGKSYKELLQIKEAMRAGEAGSEHELSQYFHEVMGEIKDKYGFEISFIQIYSLDPGSKLAEEFIRATTKVYVAEQQRDADIAAGEGLAARDKKHFEAMANIPHGADFFKWNSIKESNLTTYVEGGGVIPSIQVGGEHNRPRPSADNPPAATADQEE